MRSSHVQVIALLVCSMSVMASTQSVKPNFTGKWDLNVAKSDFGQTPPVESMVQVIEHREPNIRITTTMKSPVGQVSTVQELTTDGREHVNTIDAMGGEQAIRITGRWEGDTLATSWSLNAKGVTISFNDSWSVSEDGKVLTFIRTAKSPQGDFTVRTVYNKQ